MYQGSPTLEFDTCDALSWQEEFLRTLATETLEHLAELKASRERKARKRFFGEPTSAFPSLFGEVRFVRFNAAGRIHVVDSALIPMRAEELFISTDCGRHRVESEATVVADAGAEICEQCARSLV